MEWTVRDEKRKERVKAAIPCVKLLFDLGYGVRLDGEDREEQFACDLHGDGLDGKPSARVYPESNSWFCFACGIPRDNISTVQAKKDLTFKQAISWLERTYRLEPLPFDPEDFEKSKEEQAAGELAESLHMGETFEEGVVRFRSFLDALTIDQDLPMDTTLKFWEAFDKLCFWVAKEMLAPEKGRQTFLALRKRLEDVIEALREDS